MKAEPHRPGPRKSLKAILWPAIILLSIVALGAAYWVARFRTYTPAEMKADFAAAVAARNSPNRVERFLEHRYGPLTEPANRQKAFLDFFNTPHIEALQIIVRHTPDHMKQSNNIAMAQWIANYRRSMTSEEKQQLGVYFRSKIGRARLQQATSQYLRQGAQYRANTAPVIRELLATVAAVQQP